MEAEEAPSLFLPLARSALQNNWFRNNIHDLKFVRRLPGAMLLRGSKPGDSRLSVQRVLSYTLNHTRQEEKASSERDVYIRL